MSEVDGGTGKGLRVALAGLVLLVGGLAVWKLGSTKPPPRPRPETQPSPERRVEKEPAAGEPAAPPEAGDVSDAALIAAAMKKPVVPRYRGDNPGDVMRDLAVQTGVRMRWAGRLRFMGRIAFDPTTNPFSFEAADGTVPLEDVLERFARHFDREVHPRVFRRLPGGRPEVVVGLWKETPPAELARLEKRLRSDDVATRRRAAADLGVDPCPGKVRLLYARLLAEKDPTVLHWLENASHRDMPLAFHPPTREQAERFERLLDSGDARISAWAMRYLSFADGKLPAARVLKAMENEDERRWAAMEYAGAKGIVEAIPRLEKLLGQEPWWWGASGALARYDRPRAREILLAAAGKLNEQVFWRIQSEPWLFGRKKTVAIMTRYNNEFGHWTVKIGASYALGFLARVEPAAFDALGASESPWALQGMGVARDPRSFDVLAKAARSGSPAAAACACRGLAVLRADEKKTLALMEEAWKRTGEEIKVSKNIVVAMAMMKGPRVTERMLEMSGDPRPDVAQRAISGLIRVPGEKAEAAIRKLLRSESSDAVHSAVYCLAERAGPERMRCLVELARHSLPLVRSGAAQALPDMNRPEVVEPLVACARDADPTVRAQAVRSLGWVGDPRVVPTLLGALDDADVRVQTAATEALKRFIYLPEVRKRLEEKPADEF
ncbi:MAG: HEAT repeat domain-containing protein [Planctomycetota bacterium]|jgi:HEAT repeat protein